MSAEGRDPAICNVSNIGEGKDEMTKASIDLQDLSRRIYVKAKAEPSWRFWGLYVHVCKMETLRAAYEMAKRNDGAPGIDGVTFEAIEAQGVDVLLAFFILAIQLFVTLIEFKLTTLAGFILIPFGLFGKTAFAAERVLGNVISSGVKVMVLAVIVGIGSSLFSQFTVSSAGAQVGIEDAMALVLAPLSLLGLGNFWS